MTLDELYARAHQTPSDINQHVGNLAALAATHPRVVELGVRSGVSTTGLLWGQPASLLCVDIDPACARVIDRLKAVAGLTELAFICGDSAAIDLPPHDLLFIDTEHTYEHLSRELARHAPQVSRTIALHDTTTFARELRPAIHELIASGPWRVAREWTNNNGLMILERI